MTNAPLPPKVEHAIDGLASGDRAVQGPSYEFLSDAVAGKVGWADPAWNKLKPLLRHKNNRVRSIAGQVLCGLAPSASHSLVGHGLDELISVTRDERFVTARHVLLALWKVGVGNPNSDVSCSAGCQSASGRAPARRTPRSCATTSFARCAAFSTRPATKRSRPRPWC